MIIEEHVEIAAHSFIGKNTHIKSGAVIGAGTVIARDGYERRRVHGRYRVMPHVGGVLIDQNVTIGSLCTVDKHLWNESTVIGPEVTTDAHVHIAHNCVIGAGCGFAAHAEISGSCLLGQNVWIGPGVSTTNGISIGSYAFVSTGSVLMRDVVSHARMMGNPARQLGWSCVCRGELVQHDAQWICKLCHKKYQLENGALTHSRE